MKKLSALVLALILALLPILALAQDAAPSEEGDGWTDESADSWTDETPDARATAQSALPLAALIARSFTLGAQPFDGAPDDMTAWALSYAALEQGAVAAPETGITLDVLKAAYAAIFSQGELPEMPEDFTLLAPEGDLYQPTSDPGDAGYAPYLLDASGSDGIVDAEYAVMATSPDAPEDLTALVAVTLTPDESSPFGATALSVIPITGAPAMTQAEATANLKEYKGITYAAKNVLDGDLTTCWSYPKEDEGAVITLKADEPQAVRGIRLTPAYAKSKKIALANNRVKSFRVALSDGASFDFEVSPDLPGDLYDQYASFAFDGVHEITWASVEVTEVYPGGQYTDTCISEIALF